jgi:steroid delta-isomerase-like uncharacterized protein
MRNERNVQLSRRWFAEVWNANRLEVVDEMLAPDVIIHGLGEDGSDLVGSHHFKTFQRNFAGAFPDLHIAVDGVMSEGDQTAVRLTFTGTHTGDGLGLPPTGRRVKVSALVWCVWRDGRLIEGWNEFDAAGMLRQLTAAPPAAKLRV